MVLKKYFSLFIITLLFFNSYSQIESKGIPFIKNYSRVDYDGNQQTWAIVQDDRGVMYFANHTYILEYDGTTWRKIFIPGDPTIYSMAKDQNGKIFIGATNGEIGCLEVAEDGNMKYVSLKDKIPEDKKDFTQVRETILAPDNSILFITTPSIYIYKNDTITTIDVKKPDNRFINPYLVDDKLIIQERGGGLHEFINGTLKFLEGTEIFAGKFVTGIFPGDNKLYITTWQDSVYTFKGNTVQSVGKNPLFGSLYKSSKLSENLYGGGLYGKGLILFDKDLNVLKYITTESGLQNNSVWAAYTDQDKNLWLGTNDGISVVYADVPFSVFSVNQNLKETVYSSQFFNNTLYIGSSTGIYYRDFSTSRINETPFEIVGNPSAATQIWRIDTIKNKLICGSAMGMFLVENNVAQLIGPNFSVKDFIQLKDNRNQIISTGGNGLSLYEYQNGTWVYKHAMKNFKGDYRHIVEDTDGSFWISDRSKGVFRISINEEKDSVTKETAYTVADGLPDSLNNYVYEVNNRIIFTTAKGIYSYDKNLKKFVKDPEFENICDYDISITNLFQAENGNIWFKEELEDPRIKNKKHWELGLIKEVNGNYEIFRTPFYKVRNRINSINQISDNELLVGTEAGFVLYDLGNKKEFEKSYNALIRKVEFIKNDSVLFGGAFLDQNQELSPVQAPGSILEIPFEFNDLRFNFSSVFYEEPEKTQYSFILKGNDDGWSDWKSITSKEYSNLAPGSYTFMVKAKNLYNVESQTAEYSFRISPPWYQTFWAYIGYFIVFILFIYGVIQLSIYRLKKQRENLKRIVDERTKEIQIQKEEIEAKNEILSEQNEEIIQKNNSITASINYAKRIQEAMLPLKEKITAGLPENFILFKPRDIVSGDFYWYAERDGKIIYTAVDCTGHGVPGALMSMIGSEILTTIVNANVLKADRILEDMNNYVVKALKQETEGLSQDGMDMALCVIDKEAKTVEFAGAKNPMIYIHDGQLTQVKANRSGIGGYQQEKKTFTSELVKYESPTWFYMFTDGYQDQFGGPRNRKFMIKRMKEIIFDAHYKSMQEQHDILNKEIDEWMINTPQTDDILLTGFKL